MNMNNGYLCSKKVVIANMTKVAVIQVAYDGKTRTMVFVGFILDLSFTSFSMLPLKNGKGNWGQNFCEEAASSKRGHWFPREFYILFQKKEKSKNVTRENGQSELPTRQFFCGLIVLLSSFQGLALLSNAI